MIKKISEKILNYLIIKKVISDKKEDTDYYKYGIEITVSSLLNVLLIMLIGSVLGNFIESIIFLALFIPIRQFTGGFHANTYFKCNLIFCLSFIIAIIIYKLTNATLTSYVSILITFTSVLLMLFRCPIEHKNKPIPKKRRIFHKIMAVTLGSVYGIAGTALVVLSNKYGALIIYTLSLVTVLIIVALIIEWRCEYESSKK